MAPRLLALPGLPRGLRTWMEQQAWDQPLVVARLHRLYPKVLDAEGLRVALVKARLETANSIAT